MPGAAFAPDVFWNTTDRSGGPEACWPWMGNRLQSTGRARAGYGRLHLSHTQEVKAHRYAYTLAHPDEDVGGLHVLHRCDNPPCVNPAHLFLGTNLENARDRSVKGRSRNRYSVVNLGRVADMSKPVRAPAITVSDLDPPPILRLTSHPASLERAARLDWVATQSARGAGRRVIAARLGVSPARVKQLLADARARE